MIRNFTYTQAKRNLSAVLDQAILDGKVSITRRNGKKYLIQLLDDKPSLLNSLNVDHRIPENPLFRWSPIISVTPKDDFILILEFEDGMKGDLDMKPLMTRGGGFEDLDECEVFNSVKTINNGYSIEWKNGAELGADLIFTHIWFSDYEII
jgi:hypothetical protein